MFLARRCGNSSAIRLVARSQRQHVAVCASSGRHHHVHQPASITSITQVMSSLRPFSTTGTNGDGDDNNNNNKKGNEIETNFFLQNEDSLPRPPSYIRDATTGKWTGETHEELSSKDRKLLNLDDDSKSEEVIHHLEERWQSALAGEDQDSADDGFGKLSKEHERVANRIQEQQMALGPIGRDPSLVSKKGNDADNHVETPLTAREYQAVRAYAQKEHSVQLDESDPDILPHNTISSGSDGSAPANAFYDADLDLAYLNPKLSKQAFHDSDSAYDEMNDDPFADLLPSDLNPARKVNRRHAKLLPKSLLHHNNLTLLRRYISPGGKIMNRVQSRLGAKDQRKVAKLIKRARHLGLIPHMGQWKLEDHGYYHERGLADADASENGVDGKRDWEVELEKRGLWPLADEKEVVKRWMDMDKLMEHLGGGMDGKKREELEELLSAGTLGWEKKEKLKKDEQN